MKPYYQDESVTLYHGDCREVVPCLTGWGALLTDPPYGINYLASAEYATNRDRIANDATTELLEWAIDLAHDIAPMPACVFGAEHAPNRRHYAGAWITWVKNSSGYGHNGTRAEHELAWMPNSARWYALHCVHGGYLNANDPGNARHHPTEKPIPMLRELIELAMPNATCILDPFAGSGTTLRAAKDLGRKAIGVELEERYCEVIAKRCAQEVLPL